VYGVTIVLRQKASHGHITGIACDSSVGLVLGSELDIVQSGLVSLESLFEAWRITFAAHASKNFINNEDPIELKRQGFFVTPWPIQIWTPKDSPFLTDKANPAMIAGIFSRSFKFTISTGECM
jgi:hypothetical protein